MSASLVGSEMCIRDSPYPLEAPRMERPLFSSALPSQGHGKREATRARQTTTHGSTATEPAPYQRPRPSGDYQ
eukprot:3243244-Alexandrium_andersonii.AAC.1